jgi:hypothetical protein
MHRLHLTPHAPLARRRRMLDPSFHGGEPEMLALSEELQLPITGRAPGALPASLGVASRAGPGPRR